MDNENNEESNALKNCTNQEEQNAENNHANQEEHSVENNHVNQEEHSVENNHANQEEQAPKEIVRCLNCGAILENEQEFCPKCGTKKGDKKIIICPKCNTEIKIGQKFCPKCGEKIKLESKTVIDSVKTNFQKKINTMDSKKVKKRIIRLVILIAIIALIILGIKTIGAKMFVSTDELLSVGNYQEAYNKAKKENKTEVYWENVLFYVCKDVRSGYKNPSTFDLREAWIDKDKKRIVLKTGGANSYGGIVSGYDYITFDDKDKKFELWCSLSSLDEEKTYSWDDSSDTIEKILKNAARTNVKDIIKKDDLLVDSKVIDRVNNLFKGDKYKNVTLLDESVTELYITDKGSDKS